MRQKVSCPFALREMAGVYEREGHALFSRSEELLAIATEYLERSRSLRSEAEDLERVEEAKEFLGPRVELVRDTAA